MKHNYHLMRIYHVSSTTLSTSFIISFNPQDILHAQAALGLGDQPHYPASRVNSNNSPHFSTHCVPGASLPGAELPPPPNPYEQTPGNYCPQYIDERTAAAPESWMTRLGSHS